MFILIEMQNQIFSANHTGGVEQCQQKEASVCMLH